MASITYSNFLRLHEGWGKRLKSLSSIPCRQLEHWQYQQDNLLDAEKDCSILKSIRVFRNQSEFSAKAGLKYDRVKGIGSGLC